jgi:signal transduction histidine kinase
VIAFRVLTLVTVIGVALWRLGSYTSPVGVTAVLLAMTVWTAVLARGYLGAPPDAPDRRGLLAVADVVVCVGIMMTTPLLVTPDQLDLGTPGMGSIWTSGSLLALAVAYTLPGGLAGAAAISAALVVSKSRVSLAELSDIELLTLAGLTVGFASLVLRRAAERVRRAVAEQAAAAERERLARSIHDGVLQVLAHVRRRGSELGGGAAELGMLAGEQEVALRTLLTSGSSAEDRRGKRDLAAALRALSSGRVTVSAPAHPVELSAGTVVRAALANVETHVGPDAPAWVLVEDLGRSVEVSVRDDGPGIPEGRLDEAAEQGRLGVARSMRGRVSDLGGSLELDTGPGRGTEWIIRVPVEA